MIASELYIKPYLILYACAKIQASFLKSKEVIDF